VGLACGAVGFVIYAFASTTSLFMLGIPMSALWGLAGPSAQGLMTRRVQPHEQGQLQGAISSLRGISGLIGPLIFTQTFALFVGPGRDPAWSGAPFLLAAATLICAFAAAAFASSPRASA
jgi:DHA1 family tetracycline resistance protein-like MFS transporter